MEIVRFAFLRPSLGDLGVTYDDHLRLIGKRAVDFLLAIIELFCLVLWLRRYEQISIEVGVFAGTGLVWPKISGRRGRPPPTILLLSKLG